MIFDVYGTVIQLRRGPDGWEALYRGDGGVLRPAQDVVVPEELAEGELLRYLADLRHEYASAEHPDVRRLD